MGLIKRTHIHDAGDRLLQEPAENEASRQNGHPLERSITELTEDEQKLLGPVRDEAERILAEARHQADQIAVSAQREAESIRSSAKEEGYAAARKNAEDDLADTSAEILETMNRAITERRNIISDAEGEILRLALKAAEQIVKSEVSLHRDVCLNIIAEAISRVSDREQIILRVSREDLENVKRLKDRIAGMVDGVKQLSILEDSTVEAGGAIIETNLGFVDARISTKIKALELAVRKVQGSENKT